MRERGNGQPTSNDSNIARQILPPPPPLLVLVVVLLLQQLLLLVLLMLLRRRLLLLALLLLLLPLTLKRVIPDYFNCLTTPSTDSVPGVHAHIETERFEICAIHHVLRSDSFNQFHFLPCQFYFLTANIKPTTNTENNVSGLVTVRARTDT